MRIFRLKGQFLGIYLIKFSLTYVKACLRLYLASMMNFFGGNSWQLNAFNLFRHKLHHRFVTRIWINLWKFRLHTISSCIVAILTYLCFKTIWCISVYLYLSIKVTFFNNRGFANFKCWWIFSKFLVHNLCKTIATCMSHKPIFASTTIYYRYRHVSKTGIVYRTNATDQNTS